jgi:demethylmenaquinone methyltransferase/2-methoxy-6-polyprenyl-1,4-benzoquinol methylase
MATKFENYDIVKGFDSIAPAYDRGNDAMTIGLHRRWRAELCRQAVAATPANGRVLDLATGTGDVVIGMLRLREDLDVMGVDPSEGMLAVGRQKLSKLGFNAIDMRVGDARALPFEDASFDTITIAWGIRNVIPFDAGLREMLRVLRPGGTILILESGTPRNPIARVLYRFYSNALPYIGGFVSGYKPAYEYYKASVEKFPSDQAFTTAIESAGFEQARYQALMLGIIYLYTGKRKS